MRVGVRGLRSETGLKFHELGLDFAMATQVDAPDRAAFDATPRVPIPSIKIIGLKKLPNFSEEYLHSDAQVKRIRYLELPQKTMRPAMRPMPLQIDNILSRSRGTGGQEVVPVTDTHKRVEKLRRFEKACSWAIDHVYFGGEGVAKDEAILRAHGITHIVNCVRLEHDNYFAGKMKYLGLYLQDSGAEDILCVLYDVFDFIETAKKEGGRVFIHCAQGVSRSAALVIAYAMWRDGLGFDVVKPEMKMKRGVVDPNANFSLQLIYWEKLLAATGPHCRVHRLAPQSRHRPTYLVPKLYTPPISSTDQRFEHDVLDPRGAFALRFAHKAILWVGENCPDPFVTAGRRFLCQLEKYEGIAFFEEIRQGQETSEFIALLGANPEAWSPNTLSYEHTQFSPDYNLYHNALTPRSSVTEGLPVTPNLLPPLPLPSRNFRRCLSEPIHETC